MTARAGRAVLGAAMDATAILDAGGHLVMRVRQGISLPAVPGGWLSDGSRMPYLNAPSRRVAGRNVAVYGTGYGGPDLGIKLTREPDATPPVATGALVSPASLPQSADSQSE